MSGLLRHAATWRTWDDQDRQIAVAQWVERDLCCVFPIAWAHARGPKGMVLRAKERFAEVEAKAGRPLVAGSVLLAFSEHQDLPPEERLAPEVDRSLIRLN